MTGVQKTKNLRVVIVDDEELARGLIREYLSLHSECDVVAECSNGFEAVKAITELEPDLVFLDIQMPKLSGFDVLELLGKKPAIIFVTAYDQYALKAFEVHAVDYLLKPVGPEKFDAALARAAQSVEAQKLPDLSTLPSVVRSKGSHLERVLVREGSRVVILGVESIDYFEGQDDYVAIHVGPKRHLKQQRLTDLETQLDPARFVRIHRSYILNLERLSGIEPSGKESRAALCRDGTRLPVSRAGYAKLKEYL